MVFRGYGYALCFLVGASCSWYVQGLRWDIDATERDIATVISIRNNVDAVNQQLIASRAQTESIRATFIEYKAGKENETSALERAIADGTKRLRIKASCPAVPAAGTVPGGTSAGTTELDPAVRQDYFELKRGLDRQYAELQFCRSELRNRSSN